MSNPNYTSNIEQFINCKSTQSINYNNLSYLETLSNGLQSPIWNTVTDYIDDIKSLSSIVEFTDEQYSRYKYKPKLLCNELYGNPEVYFVILLINNMIDIKDFNSKKVKLISKSSMESLMSTIYNAEKTMVSEYNT